MNPFSEIVVLGRATEETMGVSGPNTDGVSGGICETKAAPPCA